jgi:light-regulated signal transduction histidine kinase (bacteriophytochrome)
LKTKLEGKLPAEDLQLMQRVETATERMKLLVDDLLDYSHVSRSQVEEEEVDLNRKVQLVLTDLELLITEKGAQVKVGPLPVVKGHRRQLQQLFQNLIANAIKYNQPGVTPVVEITSQQITGEESGTAVAKEDGKKLFHLVEVKDNGIGFDQQYAGKIFNIFTRLHGNIEYSGTGVGLAIAKKVVTNHGGYIWAESESGKGATFRVLLPVETNS